VLQEAVRRAPRGCLAHYDLAMVIARRGISPGPGRSSTPPLGIKVLATALVQKGVAAIQWKGDVAAMRAQLDSSARRSARRTAPCFMRCGAADGAGAGAGGARRGADAARIPGGQRVSPARRPGRGRANQARAGHLARAQWRMARDSARAIAGDPRTRTTGFNSPRRSRGSARPRRRRARSRRSSGVAPSAHSLARRKPGALLRRAGRSGATVDYLRQAVNRRSQFTQS